METTLLCAFLSFLVAVVAVTQWRSRHRRLRLPPSPRGLPFIGHLHLLKRPIHRTFNRLSRDLESGVFSLRFGSQLVVVVSSPSAVEECFTKNDVVLANRPTSLHSKHLAYDNTTIVTAQYGNHWRNLRRFMAVEVFSNASLKVSASVRREEIEILLRSLNNSSSSCGDFAGVQLKSRVFATNFNIITRMTAGRRYYSQELEDSKESSELRQAMRDFLIYGGMNLADFIPILKWIDYGGYQKHLKRVRQDLDVLLQGLVHEHRNNHKTNNNSMIDHLLSLQESEPEYYTDQVIQGLIQIMIIAGIDTSAATVEWAMSNLLNHPDMLKKVQAELDTHIGQDRLVDEADLSNLKYLQAIISETLRLFPPSPMLLPHMASDHCTIGGYDVPRNTYVLINAWAMQRDPNLWEDPEIFMPERFEDGQIADGQSLIIPFGLGRRACPGAGMAQRVVGLTLASLIQCFEWKRVDENPIDLTEGQGLTMPKLDPLKAMCKPRRYIMDKVLGVAESPKD